MSRKSKEPYKIVGAVPEAELKITCFDQEDGRIVWEWVRHNPDLFPGLKLGSAAMADALEAGIVYQNPMKGQEVTENRGIFATADMILKADPLAEIRATPTDNPKWPWEIVEKPINGIDKNGVMIKTEQTVLQKTPAPVLKAIKQVFEKANLAMPSWLEHAQNKEVKRIGRVTKQRSNMQVNEGGRQYKFSYDRGTVKMVDGKPALGFAEIEIEDAGYDGSESKDEVSRRLADQARKFSACPIPLVWEDRFRPPAKGVLRLGVKSKLAAGIHRLQETFRQADPDISRKIIGRLSPTEFQLIPPEDLAALTPE